MVLVVLTRILDELGVAQMFGKEPAIFLKKLRQKGLLLRMAAA